MSRKKISDVLKSVIIEFILVSPIAYFITGLQVSNTEHSIKFLLLVFTNFIITSYLFYFLNKKNKLIPLSISVVSMIILQFSFIENEKLIITYIIFCVYIIVRSNLAYKEEDINEIPSYYYYLALIIYLVGLFLIKRIESLENYKTVFSILAFLSFINLFFQLNKKEIVTGARNKNRTPFKLIQQNRKIVGITLFIIIVFSFIKQIADSIKFLINSTINLFIKFLLFLSSLMGSEQIEAERNNNMSMNNLLPVEESASKSTPKFVMIIIYIIASAALLAFVSFLLYKLFKFLKILFNKFILWLKDNKERFNDVYLYEDEKEVNIDIKKNAKEYYNKFKDRLNKMLSNKDKWKKMKTDRERIRFIYKYKIKMLLNKGFLYKNTLTPTEVLNEVKKEVYNENIIDTELISIYNKARYSNKSLQEKETKDIINNFNIQ